MATDIEQVQGALVEFDRVSAGLAQLQQNYAGVLYDVETPNGMELAKAARLVLRKPRYEIERIRKEAKAPLLAIGKKLDAEASRITGEILKLEEPIDQQIKSEENRKQREREEAEAREAARLAAIQARLAEIRRLPVLAGGKTSAHAKATLEQAMTTDLQGLGPEGDEALNTAIYAIKGVIVEREQHEAEQARIAAEREELARLRAEQERREAEDRAKRAEEERIARESREAETARQQAELAAQRAEQERVAQAERERLAAERRQQEEALAEERRRQQEAAAAEQARLDRERAELVAEQERLRKARDAEEVAKRAAKRPTDEEIIAALSGHFKVKPDVVRTWLGWKVEAAA